MSVQDKGGSRGKRARLMDGVRLVGLAGVTLAAAANVAAAQNTQPAQPAAASADSSEVIVVTGSRIPQPNLQSVSPVQVITGESFQQQGTYEASDVLNNLPQNFLNSGTDFSNAPNPLSGPGGVTTVNLRGLGPQRTLVLVDGVRLGVGDSNSGNPNPGPDLDQIPGQLVSRVEVVTGGASATYGSDAVAGVVNFVMKHNFEGFQIDARYGWDNHTNDLDHIQDIVSGAGLPTPAHHVTDGENNDISIVMGTNSGDGKGNVTAYLGYHRQTPVSQADRDFSGCLLASTGTDFVCANSSNSNKFINAATGDTFAVLGTNFVPWGTAGTNPPQTFNSSPYQYLSRDDTRYTAGFMAHYDINEHVTFYSDLNFMDDRTTTQVAPTAIFQQNGVFQVNCDNPLLSSQQKTALGCVGSENVGLVIGRRDVEGGGRQSFYEHESYRFVSGFRGDIAGPWHYDIYGQYYYATLENQYLHDLNKQHVADALQVVDVGGVPTCKAVVDGSDPLCVPYNLFSDGGVTPAALSYVGAFGEAWGSSEQSILSANLTGDLGEAGMKSPWATEGVSVAFGLEYRREAAKYIPDTLWQSGLLTGAGGATPATFGAYNVSEVYGEARVPVIQDVPLFQDVSLDVGYRYSHYSNAGGTDTYKAGGEWAPANDLRFRMSYQRAVRAPNLTELFVPQYVTNSAILQVDPCAGSPGSPATATLAQCMNTGVTSAEYGDGENTNHVLACPAGQCSVEQGGNVALKPETSDSFTAGFILTPSFLPGFVASVDYYRIAQDGVIGSIPATTILNNCLTTGDATACSRIHRTPQGYLFGDTVTGGGFIQNVLENLASAKNSGVDVQINSPLPLPESMGRFTVQLVGSYTQHVYVKNDPNSDTYDCAGLFGPTCGAISPKWRHTVRVTWDSPWDVMLSGQWRYIGSSKLDANSDQPVIGIGLGDEANAKLDAISYFDLSGSWNLSPTMILRATVNNVFDKSPQVISGFDTSGVGGPNAYPTYDLLGRVFSVGVTANF
ncbi:MAG: TonB-dependent receptor [Alphaproteobacteria bacterium]